MDHLPELHLADLELQGLRATSRNASGGSVSATESFPAAPGAMRSSSASSNRATAAAQFCAESTSCHGFAEEPRDRRPQSNG